MRSIKLQHFPCRISIYSLRYFFSHLITFFMYHTRAYLSYFSFYLCNFNELINQLIRLTCFIIPSLTLISKQHIFMYSHLFFSPAAIGFKTLPFRIESSNCSRGDGLRFNGASFLSVA